MRLVPIVVATAAALLVNVGAQQLPPEVMQMDRQNAQLAIEAAARGPVNGVPLIGGRGRPMGAVYDQFFIGVLIARARMVAGDAITADGLLAHDQWKSRATVIVAYPVDCEGKPNHPTAIRVSMARAMPVPPVMIGEPLRGDAGQALLPGIGVPGDALVVAYRNMPPIGTTIEMDYDNPVCGGAAKTASLSVNHMPSRELSTAFAGIKIPDTLTSIPSPTTVRIRVTLDPVGRVRFPSQMQGPAELAPAAIAAMNARTFQPATENGVPVPSNMLVTFVFTATGKPAPAEPFLPGPPIPGTIQSTVTTSIPTSAPPTGAAPPNAGGPPIMTSTTVNGRLPGSQTNDEPGLTAATSKCPIATDRAYGLTTASPVKVGGDFNQGPARERQYLSALRGPNGQGLSFVRRGSTMSPDKTILDLWEVSYAGLAKPIQIYLDQYREEPLKAPQGFVCATALAR